MEASPKPQENCSLSKKEWKNIWDRANDQNNEIGFDITRKSWTRLNRIRTGHGNCAHSLFQWNMADSANCDCGALPQTMQHNVNILSELTVVSKG